MKVVVIGSSGYVGQATVGKLLSLKGDDEIVAVTRDIEKEAVKGLASNGASVVAGDMGNSKSLDAALAGATAAYIVVPGHIDRTAMGLNALEACKRQNVGFVLMLSVCSADRKGRIFADQFKPLEEATAASGLPFCVVRMPMFLENLGAQAQSVANASSIYTPIDASKKYNSASVGDLGEAAAKILLAPAEHHGKTYNLVGSLTDESATAAGVSKATGKTVQHVQVPYAAAKEAFMGMGFPEWQTDGVIELMEDINNGEEWTTLSDADTKAVLGRDPSPVESVAAYLFGGK